MTKKRSINAGNGLVLLFVIFTVLCLSVLALLSVQTARNDALLARRYGEAVQAYYAADAQASRIRAALEQSRAATVGGIPIAWAGERAHYVCPVDGALQLEVVLHMNGTASTVEQWRTIPQGDWSAQNTIAVWDGT